MKNDLMPDCFGEPVQECKRCKGEGQIFERLAFDPPPDIGGIKSRTCPNCHGIGFIEKKKD